MQRPDYIPADYHRIHVVGRMKDLFNAHMDRDVNCILFPRTISGDYEGLVLCLDAAVKRSPQLILNHIFTPGKTGPRPSLRLLRGIASSETPEIAEAAETVIDDIEKIRLHSDFIKLRIVWPESYDPSINVFHHDTTNAHNDLVGRYMCCYAGKVTEALRNDQAHKSAKNDEYAAIPGARVITFNKGDLWRQSIVFRRTWIPPFIHRAPDHVKGEPPRLLLVG